MNQKLRLQRLKATIDRLKKLPESKFSYKRFVTEYNEQSSCGTVCCVAGWYPVWYPNEFKYSTPRSERIAILRKNRGIFSTAADSLQEYHGLDANAIAVLFYGGLIHFRINNDRENQLMRLSLEYNLIKDIEGYHVYIGLPRGIDSSLKQVTELFEFFYILIEKQLIIF